MLFTQQWKLEITHASPIAGKSESRCSMYGWKDNIKNISTCIWSTFVLTVKITGVAFAKMSKSVLLLTKILTVFSQFVSPYERNIGTYPA
jgi:hypothetical protein